MRGPGFRAAYGAGPVHLLTVVASFALLAYVLSLWGLSSLWDPDVWWQSVLVWLLGAVLLHDLVLFPLYALVDRVLVRTLSPDRGREDRTAPRVAPLNYVRIPAMAVGLLFLLFFPGILQQGADAHLRATGLTQQPFLMRWVLLSVGIFALSGALFLVRRFLVGSREAR